MNRSPLRKVSKKRRKLAPARKRCIEAVRERSGGVCEVCHRRPGVCGHEKVRRSQGGSITDPANVIWICALCHSTIHQFVAAAYDMGLLVRRTPA